MASDKHRSKKEKEKVESLSHMRLCDPMDPSPPGSAVPGFSRQERWTGLPFPSPGDLPDPGIEPRSPALQADTSPSEPPGKPQEKDTQNKNKTCICRELSV